MQHLYADRAMTADCPGRVVEISIGGIRYKVDSRLKPRPDAAPDLVKTAPGETVPPTAARKPGA